MFLFLPPRAHAIVPFLRSSRLHRRAVARTFTLLKKFSSACVENASSPAKTVSLARISASDSRPRRVGKGAADTFTPDRYLRSAPSVRRLTLAAFAARPPYNFVKQPMLRRPADIRARAPRISPAFAGASFRSPNDGDGAPRRRGCLRGALASLAIGTPRLSALHRGDL